MKIVFICSSLEPGKDGVGDYTRKFAAALIRHGHSAAVIAINDRRLAEIAVLEEKQCDDNVAVEVLRLSASLPRKVRVQKAKAFIAEFDPGWLSLQYVPFGFQIKGLPFYLGKKLKELGGQRNWHIMFHELSVNKEESLKFRIWGTLQVQIIKRILRDLRPKFITTNTSIYQQRLEQMGFPVILLPLFSNITRVEVPDKIRIDDLVPAYLLNDKADYVVGTVFGTLSFKSWDLRSLLDKLSAGYKGKKVVVASLGRMSSGEVDWKLLQQEYPDIIFLTFGAQDAAFISFWLTHYTDFGILTTLPDLAGKSGSFMAFKAHGIPVVCKERDEKLQRIWNVVLDESLFEIRTSNNIFILPEKYPPQPVLENVVRLFISHIKSA